MPLTPTGKEVLANMQKEYGAKKGKSVFYAMAHSKGSKWHHSPDSYTDDNPHGEAPGRNHYSSEPTNMNGPETAQKAGASRGSIQQSDGTDNPRANNRTKSAAIPGDSPNGTTRFPNIDEYNETENTRS